jgi:glycosyltransferase involved in cell wall biosynthesis
MNVCILAPENSPSWGGVGSYVYNLVNNFPREVGVHILTISRNTDYSYKEIFNQDYENVHVHEIIKVDESDTFFYNLKFQCAILSKLKKLNKYYDFDIIHSHSGHLPHIFSQFQDISPLVVTVHATVKGIRQSVENCSNCKVDRTETFMNVFSRGIECFEKINFKKADLLLPVSIFTSKEITEKYGVDISGKSEVMNTAVDLNKFRFVGKEIDDKPVILFAGRFYAVKGFETFLDSIEILAKNGYRFKTILVGRGNTESVSKRLSSIIPSSDFSIKGLVKYSEMPKIFEYADILVVPSIYENCPTIILEAMSSGKIVIASRVGGIPEIIENNYNGFLFEKGNSKELAQLLANILEKTVNISQIQKNARKTVELKYSWCIRSKEIVTTYKKTVSLCEDNPRSDSISSHARC